MKKLIVLFVLCGFSISAFASDEVVESQQNIESVIASIPTLVEWEAWSRLPNKQDDKMSESDKAFAARIWAAKKNYKQLENLIQIGKSISDYPGILALGSIRWDNKERTYRIFMRTHVDDMTYGYLGFFCSFNSSMIITRKESVLSAGP